MGKAWSASECIKTTYMLFCVYIELGQSCKKVHMSSEWQRNLLYMLHLYLEWFYLFKKISCTEHPYDILMYSVSCMQNVDIIHKCFLVYSLYVPVLHLWLYFRYSEPGWGKCRWSVHSSGPLHTPWYRRT